MRTTTPSPRGEGRRAEILKTALALFNARGTAAVSTNHIAAELGISVGNLYWHFSDKEAVLRALYEDHVRKYDEVWARPVNESEAIDVVVRALRRSFAITWDYRVIYRELATLTRADPLLRKMQSEGRERRRGELRAFQRAFIQLGLLRVPDGDATLAQLEDLGWMITSFWLPHLDLRDGTVTKRAVLDGARAVLALYLPYFTEESARALNAALDRADRDA